MEGRGCRGGLAAHDQAKGQTAKSAARMLRAAFMLIFSPGERDQSKWGIGPTFMPAEFERRLRVSPRVYDQIKTGITASDEKYFTQRKDAIGKLGATTDQKLCDAFRLLGQGVGTESVVEVSRLSESTSAKCLRASPPRHAKSRNRQICRTICRFVDFATPPLPGNAKMEL